jgi:hypothetical protein
VSRAQAARGQERCQEYGIGGKPSGDPFGPPACDQAAEEQRAFDAAQTDRLEAASEREREAAVEQAGVNRELEGKALAGDGKHAGQGWFCYSGTLGDENVGECDRDIIECGVKMGKQKVAGLATSQERCEEFAAAACFQATRTLQEGPRVFCFPDPTLCTRTHARASKREDVSEISDCAQYR